MADSGDRLDFPKATYDLLYRLVLIGDSGVGKTALLLRYADNMFNTSFITTIGIDFRIKTLDVDGKRVKLQIWDTAGQEQFHSVASSYYRNAHGIMLIYDITSAESFIHISKWVGNISSNAPTNVKQVLIGNKSDMEENRRVIEKNRGRTLAEELNMPFLETSAKTDTNVDVAFEVITQLIMEGNMEKEEVNDVVDLKGDVANNKKTRCCRSSAS
jgi:small GTP-binding protein